MKDFSIVIAHRGPEMGLWATLQSCEMVLDHSRYDYEYIVVMNGERQHQIESSANAKYLGDKCHQFIWHPDVMSAPSARQFGTHFATGKYLFFFDNHCLVHHEYFDRAVRTFEQYGADEVHSSFYFHAGEFTHYHYDLILDRNFWGTASPVPRHEKTPYKIAMSGHGGFAVRTDVWREVGGYWDGFVGYGGEEPYFDLKMWMLGKSVWVDPRMIHCHFAGKRSYSRHFHDDYYLNMMMAAYIIGGEKWLYTVMEKFTRGFRSGNSHKSMYELMVEAERRSRTRAQWLRQRQQFKSLDELLMWFDQNDVTYKAKSDL